jgi:hypothetical protein
VIQEDAKEEEYAGDARPSSMQQQVNLRFRQTEAPPRALSSEFSDKKYMFPSGEEDQRRDRILEVSDEVT